MPKTKYEDVIENWETTDEHVGDAIHKHFTKLEPSLDRWTDVYLEGKRLLGLALGETIDEDCIEADIIAGVSASAWNLALSQVVRAMNLDGVDELEQILDDMKDAD